jgi:transcriptional regulator with GAF, ATPase, and Fis domain
MRNLPPDYQPDLESAKYRLLELAQIRSVDDILQYVVDGTRNRPHSALVQIWLVDKCDQQEFCLQRSGCVLQTACLHLVAQAGPALDGSDKGGSEREGDFQRIPFGCQTIGGIAASGQPVVVTDVKPDASCLAHLAPFQRQDISYFSGQPIIFHGQVLGVLAVYTYISLPDEAQVWGRLFADHIAVALINARAFEENNRLKAQLELENSYLREEVREARAFGSIVGESSALRQNLHQVEMVAPTDATVLILGESGTGKELVAREIHQRSSRAKYPLIRVNCASIPKDLYESEFFGHAKGAFTGAIKDRAGRFEAADGGTLFLDEVAEIPLELQSKFLRVLQEKQYERVGEEKTRSVNVRIIAATNRPLKKEVDEGHFRQDLYYRLNVFPIEIPPLRQRQGDIPLLTAHFLEQAAKRLKLRLPRLTKAHVTELQSYDWPGNIRELQNVIERAVILAQNRALHFDLPSTKSPTMISPPTPDRTATTEAGQILTDAELRRRERNNVMAALTQASWKIHGPGGAAELLGLNPTTLISRIKKWGLKRRP